MGMITIKESLYNQVRPATLNKVKDLEVKAFIEKCLAQPRAGPSAAELLRDPFFDEIIDDDDENDDCSCSYQ
ncbi:Putative serine/threonine-protein kinase WNK5 [Glycine soja]|uniref:non-specific serine/threonine protein kinase n=1 Tax=Glycine soja TaxID=3848 RepID=A0A0B2SDG4_GLYSO|nr:Putative serine/threonine-protein kinase WNK5 [Glycine soja]